VAMSGQHPPQVPPRGGEPPRQPGPRLTPRQIAGIVFLVLALIFIFENTRSVKVRFIVPEVKLPLYFALLVAAVLGVLATLLIQWRRRSRKADRP
jgi:Lipopolysaccharide assembly protein A domain